ncbi:MAG: 23S rRNA (adenine(2030)-N(6))-methyltransferase RlmJ [Rhodobacteraceae bacterium]|nr:23S rRNA (adenine(2030)-N(6))-methyltransferase RlmJ [Paracoccaceae bacterium]
MLSYQHAYHAGGPADVHKHALLAWALARLAAREKPATYIETHAGRGLYDLGGPEAATTGEAAAGVLRLLPRLRPGHPYAQAVALVRDRHGAGAYPGSPLIAASLLRPADRLHLAELHPAEHRALVALMAGRRADIRHTDGLAMARALAPPLPRRGLLLVDPSWEVKADYARLPALIADLHRRWPVGVILLWYPLLAGAPQAPMLAALAARFGDRGLGHEVRFPPARPGHGLEGSGLFAINPPWGFAAAAAEVAALFRAG